MSKDFGSSFTLVAVPGSASLSSVACSSNGQYLVTTDFDGYQSGPGYIYTSSNYGKSWQVQKGLGNNFWEDLQISADGKLISAIGSSDLYLSTDSGNTWTDLSSTGKVTWASK